MPNLGLSTFGDGYYNEETFESKLGDLFADWWIESSAWHSLIDKLNAVNFDVLASRNQVSGIINSVARDLPADPGHRFPAQIGRLGSAHYKPLYFYHVGSELIEKFQEIIAAADQGKSRDTELNRPVSTIVHAGSGSVSGNEKRGLSIVRDEQSHRDSALSYRKTLAAVSKVNPPVYSRRTFESKFGLTWLKLGEPVLDIRPLIDLARETHDAKDPLTLKDSKGKGKSDDAPGENLS